MIQGSMVFAQAWVNSEQKQAINREAEVKKRLINHEALIKNTKDTELINIYEERVALYKSVQDDIGRWNEKIKAGEKENSHRYNLLSSIKMRKGEYMQMLITIRSNEKAYELFGGNYKEEPVGILSNLRSEINASLKSFDDAIANVSGLIQ